jgi:hypothetical protein
LSTIQIDKVLRALQVAISGYREPLDYSTVSSTGTLPADLRAVFRTLLSDSTLGIGLTPTLLSDSTLGIGLTPTQLDAISIAAPASIAKARQSCFLPAPIVMIAQNHGYNGNTTPVPPETIVPGGGGTPSPAPPSTISFILDAIGIKSANAVTLNSEGKGLYDPREWRWMKVLQTNIESLTVWNRDGRFVNLSPTDLTALATNADLLVALNSSDPTLAPTNPPATDVASGNGVLFIRAQPNSSSSIGSFDRLGLASADMTERGLVLHAHVDDFLNGSGSGTPDVTGNSTRKIYKLKPDGSQALDPTTGQPIILDYYRTYPTTTAIDYPASPYAFAVNGGRNLPGSMTIASDQAIYLQGDYNTITQKPAAIMADTITMLSVNCVSPGQTLDPLNIPAANINCLINDWSLKSGSTSPWTGTAIGTRAIDGPMYTAKTTSVNAAFLSFTSQSWGNLGRGGGPYYSGGLNNYMRFVEDWNGQSINYTGSLVSLGTPLEFAGGFRSGGRIPNSYFTPPDRNFNYDNSFNSYTQLPPMTPSVIYLQQDAFRRK